MRRQQSMLSELTGSWWIFLVTGIAWLVIALITLRFDTTSLATVGALLGVVLLLAGVNEFMIGIVRPDWSWAHIALGALFLLGGIIAFTQPFSAFWALASILGLWASQQVAPARAALVVLWVGVGALLRGISEIVLAFHIRQLHQAVGVR